MAPFRYSSPERNENENNSSQNIHNTTFRQIHWTNEPDSINWENYHRLQNQLQRLEMEIMGWEIEITLQPSTPEQTTHLRNLRRLHKGTKEMMRILVTDGNNCPHCQESEQETSEHNNQ